MSATDSAATTATSASGMELDHSLDTPGPSILHLEHINLQHPSQHLSTLFYTSLLSLTLDPYRTCSKSTLWFNVGQQQFHIQTGEECHTTGAVGVVLGRQQWEEIDERWQEMRSIEEVRGTQLSVERRSAEPNAAKVRLVCEHWDVLQQQTEEKQHDGGGVPYYRIVGPWGQLYDVYCSSTSTLDERSMGLAYIEETLPAAALTDVAQYYRRYFHTATELLTDVDGSTVASVTVGTRQRLLYRSPPTSSPSLTPSIPTSATWHYAIYLGPFAAIFRGMQADGLIHAFKGRSDFVTDWAAAAEVRQFRGFDIKAAPGREVVWRLEQEIRSSKHRHYNRQLVNERQMKAKERWSDLTLNGIQPPHVC